jgi:hypothetical protein
MFQFNLTLVPSNSVEQHATKERNNKRPRITVHNLGGQQHQKTVNISTQLRTTTLKD